MAFVHLSSASSPTFTVKGLCNSTCGTVVSIATLSLSKSGQALQPEVHRNITSKLLFHLFAQKVAGKSTEFSLALLVP